MYSIPPYAYCDFFDKGDLLTLAKTNRYFVNCILPKASPEITIDHDELHLGVKWVGLFPKVRLVVNLFKRSAFPDNFQEMINPISLNVTSLNCANDYEGWGLFEIRNFSHLTRLQSLSMRACRFDKVSQNSDLYHFTQLKNLDLSYHFFVQGTTVRKFTNLEHLNLDCNSVIKALDLEYLHECLTSLSLAGNSTIDPLVLPKLKLLSLNLESNTTVTADILRECRTIKELCISYDTILPLKYLTALTLLEKLSIKSACSMAPSVKMVQFNLAEMSLLTSLTNLVIHDDSKKLNITNLSLLVSLKRLKIYPSYQFKPNFQNIQDFELAHLINLTDLTIASDKMKGDCFKHLTQLTNLKVNGVKFNSSNLKYLVKLKYLSATDCDLDELNITELTSLVSLEIRCWFKSIITGVNTNLQSLAIYIYGTNYSGGIIDDKLISKLVRLRKLVMHINNVITLPCLLSLTDLVFVSLPRAKRFNQKKNKKALAMLLKNGVDFEIY
ncbi:MAG: hypothetical protein Harvfovirus7_33 [Harvfovirus sp.]|uniref:Leucine-rich repeat protein n=1 Tax=Harvfovirus sp. TaxID=2487768 RepID=A0A3G5A0T4_9VIRU|nr:MAG: hypothetical protein Harvfovirus7_33 [Harvfovirus sp.]